VTTGLFETILVFFSVFIYIFCGEGIFGTTKPGGGRREKPSHGVGNHPEGEREREREKKQQATKHVFSASALLLQSPLAPGALFSVAAEDVALLQQVGRVVLQSLDLPLQFGRPPKLRREVHPDPRRLYFL
jgi:hypothetical protein